MEYMHIQSEDWNRNVWYKNESPEQIQEIEEREEMVREWEQTLEAQEYLKGQEELRREFFELARLEARGTR
ncbi:hypothetical protein [Tumebacillus permanentifrigoris]|uniref:Uncharacterized protein n=1 Tax=Tumebacillus permanentifrigoris TaxID=378543 RepID=A0A316D8L5_9BACL|nr:hypothetical protein [Tumebacillus permanentifrigoris]PWK13336.1 hypothetical protein C7459_1072 [Tumebacillus permanentifrigoris]